MRILALTKYDVLAASTRQRFAQYAPYLRAHGHSLEISPLLDNSYLSSLNGGARAGFGRTPLAYLARLRTLLTRRDYDLLWVQYELFPYLPLAERIAGTLRRPIVCDYDDAIFHSYDEHRRPVVRRLLGSKLTPLLRAAAAVTCGNEYLRDWAAPYCPNTIVLPTVVDTEAYVPRPAEAGLRDGLVVGWLGSPTTWQNVEPLVPEILPVLAERGARLRVIGAGPQAARFPLVDSADWSEATELAELQGMDVGIMPLLDRPFQRGKCGYKLIQYMACGVPVVASPVGVNAAIVDDGRNGFLARDPSEWRRRIDRLLADAALRQRLGAEGRRLVEAHYSLEVQQPRLLALLNGVADSWRGANV